MELQKIIDIVAEVLAFPKEEITENSSFQDDLGADSLDVVEIVLRLEEEFKLQIPDEWIENIITVGDVADQIRRSHRE